MPYIGTEISPTGKPINAKGTLINKYRNLKRSYRDINAEPCETEGVPESEFLAHDLCESKSWLACNVESWSEVMEQWNKTFSRRQQSNTKAVAEFLQQYPILKLNKAPTLVELDSNRLYTCGEVLMLHWDELLKRIKDFSLQKDKIPSYFRQ
ncbi:hypothetical protein QE152_g12607 [Popillia japonica]|uniref:Uncharacterized protein n=1 Tax=Popillia japonica TaxID=7064 RepID=A0AAW1LN04_POPJA